MDSAVRFRFSIDDKGRSMGEKVSFADPIPNSSPISRSKVALIVTCGNKRDKNRNIIEKKKYQINPHIEQNHLIDLVSSKFRKYYI